LFRKIYDLKISIPVIAVKFNAAGRGITLQQGCIFSIADIITGSVP